MAASGGQYAVRFDKFLASVVVDGAAVPIEMDLTDGTFFVSETFRRGDIDGDGDVTSLDAVTALLIASGRGEAMAEQHDAGDVDTDGNGHGYANGDTGAADRDAHSHEHAGATDRNRNTNRDTNGDTGAADRDAHYHANRNSDGNGYGHGNRNGYADRDAHAHTHPATRNGSCPRRGISCELRRDDAE
ncbi:MAG: hypothetical protein HYV63_32620 [Candidatus Schekmanbacteria bacterium]|nr:hypothetical protein [Candidatus Schekmanbacteria bacterium]